MTVESATERAIFFDTDDFGVACSYTLAAGGAASTINGIFDAEYVPLAVDAEIDIASTGPVFHCQEADLPAGYDDDDTVVISAITYKAREFQTDGTGLVVVRLEKQ